VGDGDLMRDDHAELMPGGDSVGVMRRDGEDSGQMAKGQAGVLVDAISTTGATMRSRRVRRVGCGVFPS
jgi:hypothetical protein